MPLIIESHDSLPYIDADLTSETRASIQALISAELPADHITTLHPLVPTSYEPDFSRSPLIQAEHERIASGQEKIVGGIDLSRYEALEAPEAPEAPPVTTPTSDEDRPELLEQWCDVLRKAYTSSTYLSTRHQNLSLLETFGKNAWLIGNAQLEDILRGLEKELAETKGATEEVETQRRMQQEAVRGEIQTLEESWKRGVGRVIETEVAAEGLRREILERRRAGAA